MATKIKRSYYLPDKLIKLIDADCQKSGLVREKVIAASVYRFLQSGPLERAAMFEDLDKEMNKKR
jgi:hypothetical protein